MELEAVAGLLGGGRESATGLLVAVRGGVFDADGLDDYRAERAVAIVGFHLRDALQRVEGLLACRTRVR